MLDKIPVSGGSGRPSIAAARGPIRHSTALLSHGRTLVAGPRLAVGGKAEICYVRRAGRPIPIADPCGPVPKARPPAGAARLPGEQTKR